MSDVASATPEQTPAAPAKPGIVFHGSSQNLVPGAALLFGGIMAFSMGMTDVYFAEAMAWTFAAWGAMLIYGGLMDINETYEITDEALIIRNPLRFWTPRKTWAWDRIPRLDVVVKRREAADRDLMLQVYYSPQGELALERADRLYDSALAQLIQERAGLKPGDKETPKDITRIPRATKATFIYK